MPRRTLADVRRALAALPAAADVKIDDATGIYDFDAFLPAGWRWRATGARSLVVSVYSDRPAWIVAILEDLALGLEATTAEQRAEDLAEDAAGDAAELEDAVDASRCSCGAAAIEAGALCVACDAEAIGPVGDEELEA
jgi:hypothetical protein